MLLEFCSPDCGNDPGLLGLTHFRINRQTENLGGEKVGHGQCGARRKGLVAGLLVQGQGIVDFTADTRGLEVGFQSIAAAGTGDTQCILIPDVAVVRIGDGKDKARGDSGWEI